MEGAQVFVKRCVEEYNNRKQLGVEQTNAVTLIIGGNQGLGFESAKQLAQKGANVYITSRDISKGQQALDEIKKENPHGKCGLIQLDLQDDVSIDNAVKEIKERLNPLDVLVCNASAVAQGEVKEVYKTIIRTNVYGTFRLAEKALPYIKDGGRVVIVASEVANHCLCQPECVRDLDNAKSIQDTIFKKTPYYESIKDTFSSYQFSKAIQVRYVELASKDPLFQDRKIQIVACNPGFNKTNMTGYTSMAPLEPSQGAYSLVYSSLTPINVNGQFLSFGIKVDVKEKIN